MDKTSNIAKLRYDGKYVDFPGDTRQWTIVNHFIDKNGIDCYGFSLMIKSLIEKGIVPNKRGTK